MDHSILVPFLLTLFAGLSTGIGSLIAFLCKHTNRKFLSVSLGFSAGVMIYVSLIEIFTEAQETLAGELGLRAGSWATVGAFFGGMLFIAVIDKLVPSEENPHEMKPVECISGEPFDVKIEGNVSGSFPGGDSKEDKKSHSLMRMGLFTALAIAIHNFPEGLATFISALQEPEVAIPIVVAIAIHNIPEGIAVSVPIYQATGSKKKAFIYSFSSGLAEPLGAIVGWFILKPFMNDIVYGCVFAAVAGIMVFISFDELLPAAEEYGEHHLSIYGLISGMVVMAISLLLFI